jgi:hypothetical protein
MKKIINEIEAIFNRSGLTANMEIKESNIMLGLYGVRRTYSQTVLSRLHGHVFSFSLTLRTNVNKSVLMPVVFHLRVAKEWGG